MVRGWWEGGKRWDEGVVRVRVGREGGLIDVMRRGGERQC